MWLAIMSVTKRAPSSMIALAVWYAIAWFIGIAGELIFTKFVIDEPTTAGPISVIVTLAVLYFVLDRLDVGSRKDKLIILAIFFIVANIILPVIVSVIAHLMLSTI